MCTLCFDIDYIPSEVAASVNSGLGSAGAYSNDYINGLVWGGGWSGTVYYTIDNGTYGGYGWNDYEETAIQNAVNAYNNVCGINIQYVAPGSSSVDIVFATLGNFELGSGVLGVHEVPDGTDSLGLGGAEVCYGLYNYDLFSSDTDSFDIGGYDYITLIHELGHGLGLAHPHDDGGSSSVYPGVTSSQGDYGDNNLNQGIYTTMSYNDGWQTQFGSHSSPGYGYQGTPMAFDIAALQELYGVNNSYQTGNNTYTLPTVNGDNQNTYWSCIWDAGGTDTISNSGSSIACTINLNAAPLTGANAGGYVSWNSNIVGGFTIANGVVIENATGGSGNDTLTGNTANNTLDGGAGNDTMIGGAGDDIYIVDSSSDVVTESSGQGTDTVRSSTISLSLANYANVENLTLTGSSNLDLTGNDSGNTLTCNSGDNIIDGNGGTDYVVFSDTKANVITTFGFHHNNTSAIVIEGTYGTDTITDCEYITFSDQTVAVADLRAEYASSGYNPLFANATSGEASFMMADTYTGGVSGVQWQYIAQAGSIANTVIGSTGNDFMNLLGGDDAANGGAGNDVIDGGRGSNFLTGGAGTDTFFIDGRGGSITWSTITDWNNTEQLSVWGWNSNSTISWEENQGASGYEGATFRIDLDGDGDIELSCTFTGFAVADIKAPTEFEDSSLLWFV